MLFFKSLKFCNLRSSFKLSSRGILKRNFQSSRLVDSEVLKFQYLQASRISILAHIISLLVTLQYADYYENVSVTKNDYHNTAKQSEENNLGKPDAMFNKLQSIYVKLLNRQCRNIRIHVHMYAYINRYSSFTSNNSRSVRSNVPTSFYYFIDYLTRTWPRYLNSM